MHARGLLTVQGLNGTWPMITQIYETLSNLTLVYLYPHIQN